MCRSIKQLRRPEGPPTEEEIQAAALQFVRKVSGYRSPSHVNQQVFDQAVAEIAEATRKLVSSLEKGKRPSSPTLSPTNGGKGSRAD